jgi:predicted AAA+ superfamily ATPase
VILFANVPEDKGVARATMLSATASDHERAAAWDAFQRDMLAGIGRESIRATYWQNHLCSLVASSDNPFSRAAEKGAYAGLEGLSSPGEIMAAAGSLEEPSSALFRLAALELARIGEMYAWDFGTAADNVASFMASPPTGSRRQRVHEALAEDDGPVSAARLAAYYRSYGAGALEAYDSYCWDGGFSGVPESDPVELDDLIGMDRQKKALIENTEFLLRGLYASNILLYGDAGTGKSSSARAVARGFADRGLKLVALPNARIAELPAVMAAAAGRGLKFMLFIDDLSFEEDERAYKSFKSVIEGGVYSRPVNVVICVTSNRRGIVKEVWKDRERQDDVHLRDNLQEKRSLADRFGLTIGYSAPDKEEYLAIVRGLAEKEGLAVDAELEAAALTWEVRHGGRSGRTARQFIDYRVSRAWVAGVQEGGSRA